MDEKPDFNLNAPLDVGAYADALGNAKDAILTRRLRAFMVIGLVSVFIVATLGAVALIFLNAFGVTDAPWSAVLTFTGLTLGADVLSAAIPRIVRNLFP